MKREPILFIRGSKERAEEIKNILEDEWGGDNPKNLQCDDTDLVYYINQFGIILSLYFGEATLNDAIRGG